MYTQVHIDPLSKAVKSKLRRGLSVRIKHGKGHVIHLDASQMKKHNSASKKGKGHVITFHPHQIQHHYGMGFFDDIASGFNSAIVQPTQSAINTVRDTVMPVVSQAMPIISKVDDVIQKVDDVIQHPLNYVMPVVNQAGDYATKTVIPKLKKQGKKAGRYVASQLIHKGIPMATSTLGGMAGSTLGGMATANPLGAMAGEQLGSMAGQYAGDRLADYVGSKTGYGLLSSTLKFMAPHAKKAVIAVGKEVGKAVLSKGLHMAEQYANQHGIHESHVQEAKNLAHAYSQNPQAFTGSEQHILKEVIHGALSAHPAYQKSHSKMQEIFGNGMRGRSALIDQNFTVRQATDSASNFSRDPMGTFGYGIKHRKMRGGTALIDQPFTVRQATDSASNFSRDPMGTFGYGIKRKHKRGSALMPAGY